MMPAPHAAHPACLACRFLFGWLIPAVQIILAGVMLCQHGALSSITNSKLTPPLGNTTTVIMMPTGVTGGAQVAGGYGQAMVLPDGQVIMMPAGQVVQQAMGATGSVAPAAHVYMSAGAAPQQHQQQPQMAYAGGAHPGGAGGVPTATYVPQAAPAGHGGYPVASYAPQPAVAPGYAPAAAYPVSGDVPPKTTF